jgi:hypothetical protein
MVEVSGRRRRRPRQLLDGLKKKRGYWKLKEEALDLTEWRTRFGRGYGPVVRQTTGWVDSCVSSLIVHDTNFIEHIVSINFQYG